MPDPSTANQGPSVAILGAGMAGLAAAHELQNAGLAPVLFDKGRGPGGRTSTRRAEPFAFDHGAQYFTVRDGEFRRAVELWRGEGLVAPWKGRVVSLPDGLPAGASTERLVAVPRMSALSRRLERGLDLRLGKRVGELGRDGGRWRLLAAEGTDLGSFDALLITAPTGQAAELVGDLSPLGSVAASVPMQPCWAVMLGLDASYRVPWDGAFCPGEPLSWVARNSSKPGRPAAEAWVLHAGPAWSLAHMGADPAEVSRLLAEELVRLTGVALPPLAHKAAHFWRYAQPSQERSEGFQLDAERRLVLAGDAWTGGRVEGAFRSGTLAARQLVTQLIS